MKTTTGTDRAPRLPSPNDIFAYLGLMVRLEGRVLWLLTAQAIAIGIFSLIIPLTVQELVNTFAFAIQPIMVATLALILMLILLFVGALRALQFYAVKVIERRVFARVALALARQLPRFTLTRFRSRDANYFFETLLLQRALAALLADVINCTRGRDRRHDPVGPVPSVLPGL